MVQIKTSRSLRGGRAAFSRACSHKPTSSPESESAEQMNLWRVTSHRTCGCDLVTAESEHLSSSVHLLRVSRSVQYKMVGRTDGQERPERQSSTLTSALRRETEATTAEDCRLHREGGELAEQHTGCLMCSFLEQQTPHAQGARPHTTGALSACCCHVISLFKEPRRQVCKLSHWMLALL